MKLRRRVRRPAAWAAALGAMTATADASRADRLDDIRQRGTLIWGADQEGGGPYVLPDPQRPETVIGWEVDLAAMLAEALGVRAEFHQADWNTLPEFLRAGEIDVVLNGYEWSASRAARMEATRPYYIYELQLMARENDDRIRSWDDLAALAAKRRPSISILGGSAPAVYLQEQWRDRVEVVEYDGNTNAMMQAAAGIHDATLQDLPIAIYYRDKPAAAGLRFVGEPVGRGYYVMFAAKGETRLAEALNDALATAMSDGRLRRVHEKWGLWNARQEELGSARPGDTGGAVVSGWAIVTTYAPILLKAAGMTVLLSVASMPIAIVVGLTIAIGRLYGPRPLRPLLGVYVELLRGTPVMLQLYVIFFLLPKVLPFALGPVAAAIAGLAINYSAYEAEIYRAGLQAIPRGQMDAALALGMTRFTALRRIIVPQAVRIVVPPVTNDFIALFKDTSVCSVIAVTELTKQYNVLANSTGAIVELAAMTALLYLAMSYPLSLAARRMEVRQAGREERS